MQSGRMVGQSLLVVDDETLFRRALADAFDADGYTVLEACDGAEALAVLRSTAISVMVTDLTMPIMDGVALLHALDEAGLSVPTVIVSALEAPRSLARSFARGTVSFMAKPIDYENLLRHVAELVARGDDGRRWGSAPARADMRRRPRT